jgi:hypothetical protein
MKRAASASVPTATAQNHSFSFIALMATNGSSELASPPCGHSKRPRAKELRSIVEQGHDPRLTKYREGGESPPVERLIQYITEHIHTIQLLRR